MRELSSRVAIAAQRPVSADVPERTPLSRALGR
jgi:hypothetical protein